MRAAGLAAIMLVVVAECAWVGFLGWLGVTLLM